MGLTKWLLKNGPGSPGSTAKAFIREYNKITTGDHLKDWEGIFYSLFRQRFLVNQRMGFRGGSLIGEVDPVKVVEYSEGDLGLFVFHIMLMETAQFRNNIRRTFNEVTNAIYEVIKSEAPATLMFDLPTFRYKASSI